MIHRHSPSVARWLRSIVLLVVLLVFGTFAPANAAGGAHTVAAVTIGADITSDTTWTLANSPYLVTAPITVANTATLAIEPGVEVRFAAGAGLRIAGGLTAQGTQAQQIRFVGDNGAAWQGLVAVQPTRNVLVQSATISNALAGVSVRQSGPGTAHPPTRVDVLDSLLDQNTIGVDADYTITTNAPRLTLRNNLLSNNGIGFRLNGLPGGNAKPKFNHNSFVGNGIGMLALNIVGQAVKMQQQWWGSASGPQVGSPSICATVPPTGSAAAALVCGNIDFTPWSRLPSGRLRLGAGQGGALESGIGAATLSDNDVASTSTLTVTVPPGTFTQTVDLLASARAFTSMPPGKPTQLEFEITAAANGQEIHRFANNQQLTLEISYTNADLAGADPSKLVVYAYDETLGAWTTAGISTTVDPSNNRLVVRLQHLSRFSVTDVTLQYVMLPLVMR